MFQRSVLAVFIVLAILVANIWHKISACFVDTFGVGFGIVLLLVVLALVVVIDPYWD